MRERGFAEYWFHARDRLHLPENNNHIPLREEIAMEQVKKYHLKGETVCQT